MDADRRPGLFRDRRDAGERLAQLLVSCGDGSDLLVLGIPRGGVPVAARVAGALGAPLDVIIVRKLGVPGSEEMAMGAIASGGIRLLDVEVVRELRIARAAIDAVLARETVELARRERAFRGGRPAIAATGRTVILVDDGLATGSTMRAAVTAVRELGAARVVVAVPVAPVSTCRELEPLVDRLVCIVRPSEFLSVGQWYEDFTQTSDEEVRHLLHDSERAAAHASANRTARISRAARPYSLSATGATVDLEVTTMGWNVAAVMTTDVVTVGPGTIYKEVAERLRSRGVSAVPVVNADRRVIGVVSEADLLLKEERPRSSAPLVDPHCDAAKAAARNAAALMTSPAVTIRPEATLTRAARLMHREHVRRLPVVDMEDRLIGIVSRSDLLRVFLRGDESIAAEVREEVLEQMLALDPVAVSVTVDDGVVRLSGQVPTSSLAAMTTRLVEAVEGVVAVESRLGWKVDDSPAEVPALRFARYPDEWP